MESFAVLHSLKPSPLGKVDLPQAKTDEVSVRKRNG